MKDGKASTGVLGEQNGMFKDVPLANVAFDGTTLKFDAKVPTPPPTAPSVSSSLELKLGGGKLEGVLTVVEMGMSAASPASRIAGSLTPDARGARAGRPLPPGEVPITRFSI